VSIESVACGAGSLGWEKRVTHLLPVPGIKGTCENQEAFFYSRAYLRFSKVGSLEASFFSLFESMP